MITAEAMMIITMIMDVEEDEDEGDDESVYGGENCGICVMTSAGIVEPLAVGGGGANEVDIWGEIRRGFRERK